MLATGRLITLLDVAAAADGRCCGSAPEARAPSSSSTTDGTAHPLALGSGQGSIETRRACRPTGGPSTRAATTTGTWRHWSR